VISLEGTRYSSNLRGARTLPPMIEDLMFFESDQITSQLSCASARWFIACCMRAMDASETDDTVNKAGTAGAASGGPHVDNHRPRLAPQLWLLRCL
jgi:hypothetical protein